jgi:hypothetical protein
LALHQAAGHPILVNDFYLTIDPKIGIRILTPEDPTFLFKTF